MHLPRQTTCAHGPAVTEECVQAEDKACVRPLPHCRWAYHARLLQASNKLLASLHPGKARAGQALHHVLHQQRLKLRQQRPSATCLKGLLMQQTAAAQTSCTCALSSIHLPCRRLAFSAPSYYSQALHICLCMGAKAAALRLSCVRTCCAC